MFDIKSQQSEKYLIIKNVIKSLYVQYTIITYKQLQLCFLKLKLWNFITLQMFFTQKFDRQIRINPVFGNLYIKRRYQESPVKAIGYIIDLRQFIQAEHHLGIIRQRCNIQFITCPIPNIITIKFHKIKETSSVTFFLFLLIYI